MTRQLLTSKNLPLCKVLKLDMPIITWYAYNHIAVISQETQVNPMERNMHKWNTHERWKVDKSYSRWLNILFSIENRYIWEERLPLSLFNFSQFCLRIPLMVFWNPYGKQFFTLHLITWYYSYIYGILCGYLAIYIVICNDKYEEFYFPANGLG